MSVAFDTGAVSAVVFAGTSVSKNLTIAAASNVAATLGLWQSGTSSSAFSSALGGVSGSALSGSDTGTSITGRRTQIFAVTGPATGAQTASASWTTSTDAYLGVAVANGCDPSTPVNGGAHNGGPGSGEDQTVTPATGNASNDIAVGFCGSASTSSAQTALFTKATGAGDDFLGIRDVGGSALLWAVGTFSAWVASAANFQSPILPIITAQPTDQTVASGSTATFSLTATGATSYQWQQFISGAWSDIGGATSSSYTTGTLARSDGGTPFRCNVTNASGTTTSNVAIPRVTQVPTSYVAQGMVVGADTGMVGVGMVGDGTVPGGGAVSAAVTGQQVAASAGSASVAVSLALLGQAASSAAGTLAPSRALTLAGSVTSSSAGTASVATVATLIGQAASAATGSVVGGQSLAGSAIALAAGTLAPADNVALAGSAATSIAGTASSAIALALLGGSVSTAQGTVTVGAGNVTAALTGQSATLSAGALTPATASTPAGIALASSAGTLAPSDSLTLAGSAIASSAGTQSAATAPALVGASLTASRGTVVPAPAPTLSGAAIATVAGTESPATTVPLAGAATTAATGTVTAATGATAALTGQAAIATAGTLGDAATVSLAGSSIASAAGTVTATQALTGIALTSSAGNIAAAPSVGLAGASATAQPGLMASSLTRGLAGSAFSAASGSAVAGIARQLAGQPIGAATAGNISPAIVALLAHADIVFGTGSVSSVSGGLVQLSGVNIAAMQGALTALVPAPRGAGFVPRSDPEAFPGAAQSVRPGSFTTGRPQGSGERRK